MIPMFKVAMSPKASKMVEEVLQSGMVGEGPKVEDFTNRMAKRFENKQTLMLNSCTSALTLALRLEGIGPGDEVISTPFTMVATNAVIMTTGARIVWADIGQDNVNISPESVKEKITPKTKAIVVTHVGGIPCEMEKLANLGVPVIGDCAHAVDTYYQGKHIANASDYACFSFQAIKQLNTADGGAIVIRDPEKYELAKRLKWFGMSREVPPGMTRLENQMTADIKDWGYKFHMNDVAAAIGLANLEMVDEVLTKHRKNADYYRSSLRGVKPFSVPQQSISSDWVFGFFCDNRKLFIEAAKENGIEVTPMWRRNDEYSTFSKFRSILPNMDAAQNKIIFIPVGWWLKDSERYIISDTINNFFTPDGWL